MLTQIKVLGISEKQRIKLDIFVSFQKRNIFLHLKTIFFWFYFAAFERVRYFGVKFCIFFCNLLSATNL